MATETNKYMIRITHGVVDIIPYEETWYGMAKAIEAHYIEKVQDTIQFADTDEEDGISLDMIVDEEGLIRKRAINPIATMFTQYTTIFGWALLVTEHFTEDGDLDFTGFTKDQAGRIALKMRQAYENSVIWPDDKLEGIVHEGEVSAVQ